MVGIIHTQAASFQVQLELNHAVHSRAYKADEKVRIKRTD